MRSVATQRRGAHAIACVTVVALAFGATAVAGQAGAQTPAPGPSTPSPGGPGTPPADPLLPDAPDGEPPRAVAPTGFPKPTAPAKGVPVPEPLTWLTAARTSGGGVREDHGQVQSISRAKKAFKVAKRGVETTRRILRLLRHRVANVDMFLDQLDFEHDKVVARERARAVAVYTSGGGATINQFLGAESVTEQGRQAIYSDAAQTVDGSLIDRIVRQQRALEDERADLRAHVRRAEDALDVAKNDLAQAYVTMVTAAKVLTDPEHGGRVFPVQGGFDFYDSWGAFRAHKGSYNHTHRATDIMAKHGTPLVAVETGTVTKLGWNLLGGWRFWIIGDSGTSYYYAHMSAYAPGLADGVRVIAGEYVGRVGDTGNARGGPSHLHFEVHLPGEGVREDGKPKIGPPVNPYPLLCLLVGAKVPPIPPSQPDPPPPPVVPVVPAGP